MKKILNKIQSYKYFVFVFLIGIVAMIGQISLIRISAQSFYGNELTMCIVLGHWLLWTSIGSILGIRLVKKLKTELMLVILSFLYGLTILIFSYLILLSRKIFGISNSEIVGMGAIFLWTGILFIVPSIINGLFFPFLVKWIKEKTGKPNVHYTYANEVFGSAVASLLFALLIYFHLNTFQSLHFFISALFIVITFTFFKPGIKQFIIGVITILIFSISNFTIKKAIELKWHPYDLISYTESPHLSISEVSYQNEKSIFGNGEHIWTFGDKEKAEELVHFPLLIHQKPESVLIIGTSNPDIMNEIMKHESVNKITVIGQDEMFQSAMNRLSQRDEKWPVEYIFSDPFKELKSKSEKYDVIILNIPLPVNIQWNRFYTADFFEISKKCLREKGILSLQLPGGQNYLSAEHINFLKTIQNSVLRIFSDCAWIPGNTLHLLSADFPISITDQFFLDNLKNRKLDTEYIQDYYLNDRLSPMKVDFLQSGLSSCKNSSINTLLDPVGFYYDTVLWDKRTSGFLRHLYQYLKKSEIEHILGGCMLFLAFPLFYFTTKARSDLLFPYNMSVIGFILMGFETLLIIIYQSYIGAIYLRIVFLIFAFMVGAGLGALLYKYLKPTIYRLIFLIFILSLLPLPLIFGLNNLWMHKTFKVLIPLLLLISGILSGIIFPLLTNLLMQNSYHSLASSAGKIYASDIMGSCAGIYFMSAVLIPVWGIFTAIIFLEFSCFMLLFGNMFFRGTRFRR